MVKETKLTPREKSILRELRYDRTYAEIGRELSISPESVKTYLARIRAKLNIRSRAGLVVWICDNPTALEEKPCGQ